MILFSVIIPTYRRREALSICLRALTPELQGMPPESYQVIVSDDERSDETRSTVASTFPAAIYLEGPSRGPAANRNHAAKQARGEWLIFTDDDCIPAERWLVAYASAIRNGCLVYEGQTTCSAGFRSPLDTSPANDKGGLLWSCNFMIESTLFHELGAFDESFPHAAMEDVDLRERIKDQSLHFDFVPSAIVDHPPRKIRGWRELARSHQSVLYFKIVKRGIRPTLREELVHTVKTRIRYCLRPTVADLPKALYFFAAELFVLCLRFEPWCRAQRAGEFRSPPLGR